MMCKTRFIHIAGVLAVLAVLAGCSADGYESGDGKYSYMRADFVEMHSDAGETVDYVVTDDGQKLVTNPPFTLSWITVPDSVYRALMYYNLTYNESGTACAKALSVVRVPVLNIVPLRQTGNVPADPVTFESAWLSAGGKYLNMCVVLKSGTSDDNGGVQTVGVVGERTDDLPDGGRCAVLRFMHDQGGVPEYYSVRKYLSIRTSDIDADAVRIRINTYSGETEKMVYLR